MSRNEDEHVKEVYARFGLAIYFAQVLEHAVVNSLVLVEFFPTHVKSFTTREAWEKEVDGFMARHFAATLGRLIGRLSSVIPVPPDLEGMLREALSMRNWLAHEYFRERATDFMTERGRDRMIDELEAARALLQRADARLNALIRPVRQKHGLTEEKIQKIYDETLAKAGGDGYPSAQHARTKRGVVIDNRPSAGLVTIPTLRFN